MKLCIQILRNNSTIREALEKHFPSFRTLSHLLGYNIQDAVKLEKHFIQALFIPVTIYKL